MKWPRPVIASGLLAVLAALAQGQKFEDLQRQNARDMLHNIAEDIKKHYYDPAFHGIDFDARVHEADEKIKTSTSLNQAFSMIGWALDGLKDSHTYFIPPVRPFRVDYGWRMQMVGDHCYVTAVRPKSDAEAKGLKAGDELLALSGFPPNRSNFHKLQYIFNVLAPRSPMPLAVRGADGQQRQLSVDAKERQFKKVLDLTSRTGGMDIWDLIRNRETAERLNRTTCVETGDDIGVCKMPEFDLNDDQVHDFFSRVHKYKGIVLDLRHNPGGSVDTLAHMIGGFFDHDVKIGDRTGRNTMKPQVAKAGHDQFTGNLVVLVDSQSSSAAELFARVIQLEKRGKVLGDRSSGLVMEGRFYDHKLGVDTVSYYGTLITDADIVMTDGKSLESHGVIPDELLVPTQTDLSQGEDPVLAHAVESLGGKLTAEKAGKIFPYEWPND